ncbi:MAG: DNA repair and recombination protein RadB [Methanomicrobiales archaeon]|nr:DNA repair and recombination protein RadB [Methanomicrobiales archaeon]MDD1668503.1 DNA repair and recombination protein RadB [Methanomicrobiales archaeon]
MEAERVSTGIPALDTLLGGGMERRAITQFYGEPGCGKSTLALIAAVERLRAGESVIYLDTEGFSVERFRQVAGDRAEELARSLFLFEPLDFEQQGLMIAESERLLQKGGVGLIVVDSATALYRTELTSGQEAQRRLARQVIHLLGLAKRYNIPALVTNQVYMDVTRNVHMGLGGSTMAHLSKAIVRLEGSEGVRRALLEKHRSRPAGGSFYFEMTGDGIRARESP